MMDGFYDAATIQAAWRAVGAVAGCTYAHLSPGDRIHPDPNAASVVVGISGWSPSLHGVEIEYDLTIEAPASSDLTANAAPPHETARAGIERAILDALEPGLAIQRARAERAALLGIPFPVSSNLQDSRDLLHLHLDASQAAIVVERSMHHGQTPAEALRTFIAMPLRELHRNAVDHRGGHRLGSDAFDVLDHEGRSDVAFLTDLLSDPRFSHPGIGAIMKGRSISITGLAVPDTLLTASEGRLLGDLIRLHPYLDGRRVEKVVTSPDDAAGFVVHLVPDPRPFGPLHKLGAHEALEALGFAPMDAAA